VRSHVLRMIKTTLPESRLVIGEDAFNAIVPQWGLSMHFAFFMFGPCTIKRLLRRMNLGIAGMCGLHKQGGAGGSNNQGRKGAPIYLDRPWFGRGRREVR